MTLEAAILAERARAAALCSAWCTYWADLYTGQQQIAMVGYALAEKIMAGESPDVARAAHAELASERKRT